MPIWQPNDEYQGFRENRPPLGGLNYFGDQDKRIQQVLARAEACGARVEFYECLANIRDGSGRYHHNNNVKVVPVVKAAVDVIENIDKLGLLPEMAFFLKEFPGLTKPGQLEVPPEGTVIHSIGNSLVNLGWSKANYELIAQRFGRFCDTYDINGLNPRLGLFCKPGGIAQHDEGVISINMGYEGGCQKLYDSRNRIFPHEIGHLGVDNETGIINLPSHQPTMVEAWRNVCNGGVNTRHLTVPRVDFQSAVDQKMGRQNMIAEPHLYLSAKEVIADRAALDLGTHFIDREGLGGELAACSNRELYLRGFIASVGEFADGIDQDYKVMSYELDRNHVIKPARYGAIARVSMEMTDTAEMQDLVPVCAQLEKRLRGIVRGSFLGDHGLIVYDRVMPLFEKLYRDTQYRV